MGCVCVFRNRLTQYYANDTPQRREYEVTDKLNREPRNTEEANCKYSGFMGLMTTYGAASKCKYECFGWRVICMSFKTFIFINNKHDNLQLLQATGGASIWSFCCHVVEYKNITVLVFTEKVSSLTQKLTCYFKDINYLFQCSQNEKLPLGFYIKGVKMCEQLHFPRNNYWAKTQTNQEFWTKSYCNIDLIGKLISTEQICSRVCNSAIYSCLYYSCCTVFCRTTVWSWVVLVVFVTVSLSDFKCENHGRHLNIIFKLSSGVTW